MEDKENGKKVNQIEIAKPVQMAKSSGGLEMSSLDQMLTFAEYVAKSPFCPKGMTKPGDIVVALQMGAEIGLPPMSALQNTAVINGRPGIYGDAALALVRASGLLEYYKEEMIGNKTSGDDYSCKVTVKRFGYEEATEEFTIDDAKRAGLWNKAGPWTQYPKRMLKFRARGFILRDHFGDVLKGFKTTEELQDIAEEPRNVTPGNLINSVSDEPEKEDKPEPEQKPEEKKDKPKQAELIPSQASLPTEAQVTWEKLVDLCVANKIPWPEVQAWASRDGRNINLDTEEGCQKILNAWESVKEAIQRG